ncbi:MAG: hypothetical protein M1820_010395 [Bogoriella megaspora]|nr:MAG: hypothetical protein M1820_010395 [Bogoriella megaspora]
MASSAPPNPLPPNQNIGPAFLVLTCILTAFSITTTTLRVWVRRVAYKMGPDDYWMAVTTAFAIIRMALQVVQVQHGNGRHRWYLTPKQYQDINMYGWYAQVLLFITNALLKTSICLLLLRIQNTKKMRYLLYGMATGVWLTNLEPVIVLLAECNPVATYWRSSAGKCWNPKIRIYSIYMTIGYGIVSDLTLALLPIVILRNIQVSLRNKIAICGLMALGLVATGFSVARAASLGLAVNDLSWTYCIAAIWSNLELHLGIIAANLALSRSWYLYFSKGARAIKSGTSHSGLPNTPSRRSGYMLSRDNVRNSTRSPFGALSSGTRGEDTFKHDDRFEFGTNAAARRSFAGSQGSEIPLDAIRKEKSFFVTEERRSPDSSDEERSTRF